jgi:hypothetical protein
MHFLFHKNIPLTSAANKIHYTSTSAFFRLRTSRSGVRISQGAPSDLQSEMYLRPLRRFRSFSGGSSACRILPSAHLQQANNRECWKSSSSHLRKRARSHRFGSPDGYSRGTAAYQLPLSPKMSMTRASRAQPFCQLVCRARSTPSGSPSTTAAIISSCSATEKWRSLMIELA